MNMEQVREMTDQELRIKVAELLGWKFKKTVWFMRWLWGNTCTQRPIPRYPGEWLCGYIPKYATDLNAMHEAAKSLPVTKLALYCDLLLYFAGENYGGAFEATARQRAMAFVLTRESK